MTIKERIVAASTEMFSREGVRSVRMDDIAAHLGISKRTIYENFSDKEALLSACMYYHFDVMEQEYMEKIRNAQNVVESILKMLEDWDKMMATHARLITGIKKFYPALFFEKAECRREEGLSTLKSMLQQGVEQGYFLPHLSVDTTVAVFTNAVYGVLTPKNGLADKLPDIESQEDAMKYILTYFFRGISTAKGIKLFDKYLENYIENNKK